MDRKERIQRIMDDIDNTLVLGSKIKEEYKQIRDDYAKKK